VDANSHTYFSPPPARFNFISPPSFLPKTQNSKSKPLSQTLTLPLTLSQTLSLSLSPSHPSLRLSLYLRFSLYLRLKKQTPLPKKRLRRVGDHQANDAFITLRLSLNPFLPLSPLSESPSISDSISFHSLSLSYEPPKDAYFRGRKLQGTAIPIPQGILVCDSFFLSYYVCVLLFSSVCVRMAEEICGVWGFFILMLNFLIKQCYI
jgi:hypothetical protein